MDLVILKRMKLNVSIQTSGLFLALLPVFPDLTSGLFPFLLWVRHSKKISVELSVELLVVLPVVLPVG